MNIALNMESLKKTKTTRQMKDVGDFWRVLQSWSQQLQATKD